MAQKSAVKLNQVQNDQNAPSLLRRLFLLKKPTPDPPARTIEPKGRPEMVRSGSVSVPEAQSMLNRIDSIHQYAVMVARDDKTADDKNMMRAMEGLTLGLARELYPYLLIAAQRSGSEEVRLEAHRICTLVCNGANQSRDISPQK